MKRTLFLTVILALSIVTGLAQTNSDGQNQKTDQSGIKPAESSISANDDRAEWISKSLQKIEKIKTGMTRADLLKVFVEEGGPSTNLKSTYVYRECLYIKVDVEFKTAGETAKDRNKPGQTTSEHDEDIIIQISKPYLGWAVID